MRLGALLSNAKSHLNALDGEAPEPCGKEKPVPSWLIILPSVKFAPSILSTGSVLELVRLSDWFIGAPSCFVASCVCEGTAPSVAALALWGSTLDTSCNTLAGQRPVGQKPGHLLPKTSPEIPSAWQLKLRSWSNLLQGKHKMEGQNIMVWLHLHRMVEVDDSLRGIPKQVLESVT